MAVKDDVKDDLAELWGGLTRPEVEQVVSVINSRPASDVEGASVAAALKSVAPQLSSRVEALTGDDLAKYLGILKGGLIFTLKLTPGPDDPLPDLMKVQAFIDSVEG